MIAASFALVYILIVLVGCLNALTLYYLFKWLSGLNTKLIETDSAIATLFTRLNEQIADVMESSGIHEPPNPIQAMFAQIMQQSMMNKTTLNNRDEVGQFKVVENGTESKTN